MARKELDKKRYVEPKAHKAGPVTVFLLILGLSGMLFLLILLLTGFLRLS